MAGVQPTQVLPSWLSFSSFTTVDASGVPTTEATIVMLPLTYFGPSIPLGTDTRIWVYGGSTSPASTSTVPSSSQPTTSLITSSTTSSPLPSSSSPAPTATPTPTSSITSSSPSSSSSSSNSQTSLSPTISSLTSSTTSSSTPITSAPSSSSSQSQSSSSSQSHSSVASSSSSTLANPSPSIGALGNHAHHLTARAIVGIVIAGAFVLVLLGFLLFLLCRRRRRRPQQLPPAGGHSTSSWSAFEVVDPEAGAAHDPGAVGMGEHEHDPLVSGQPAMTETAPPYAAPPRLISRRPAPDASFLAHTDDPSGVALQEGLLPPHDFGDSYDDIIASSAFVVGDEPMSPGSERSSRHEDSPLLPPRTLNPDMLPTGSRNSNYSSLLNNYDRSAIPSIAYPDSPVSDVDEGAALMTARRVRVDSEDHADPPSTSGLTGFARLSRLSWLNRPLLARPHSSVSSRHSGSLGAPARRMSDRQESNRNSLNVSQARPHSMSQRSGSSGQSVYYDAASIVSDAASDPLKQSAADADPLDMPVPPSVAGSLSSMGSQARYPAFPPGLVPPDQAHLPTQLEDEPPLPGGRWKSMHGDVAAGGSMGKSAGLRGPQAFDSNTPLDLDITDSLRNSRSSGIIPASNKVVSNEFASISDQSHASHDEPSSRDTSTDLDSTPHQSESSLRLVSDRNSLRYSGFALPSLLPLYNPTGTSVSSRGSRAESSTTVAATVKDPETGAMMHFPSTVWHPSQSASEWPDDAWTEFPDGRGAKWYGPPLHLKRYREQTGDPGTL